MTDSDVLKMLTHLRDLLPFVNVTFTKEHSRILDDAIDEITRLRASPWVSVEARPVCEWQWHKLAERMVTACGNESDSVGAFCQFCGGKVEEV